GGASRDGRRRVRRALRRHAVRAPRAGRDAAQRRCRAGASRSMSDRAVGASERISAIQQRLAAGLAKIDPHHRLLGRPLSYRVIDGRTLEIPDRAWILLVEQRSMPTVAELARPWLRLAGSRINPRTNGPRQPSLVTGLVVKRVADGAERRVAAPPGGIGFPAWSPDGRRIAFTVTGDSMI